MRICSIALAATIASVRAQAAATDLCSPAEQDCNTTEFDLMQVHLLQRGASMSTAIQPAQGFDPAIAAMHYKCTCPAVGALIKNGDLVPDMSSGEPLVTLEMCETAMLRAGISPIASYFFSSPNFKSDDCPTCPEQINPFKMNSIQCEGSACKGASPPDMPHEHFRSSGLRDADEPNRELWEKVEQNCLGNGTTWLYSNAICIGEMFDCEKEPCGRGNHDLFMRLAANDVDENKRPHGGMDPKRSNANLSIVCTENDVGRSICDSQMHGAVESMFYEFGTPSGGRSSISREEYKALWMDGDYPELFLKRSPRSCMSFTGTTAGCDRCWSEINASSPEAFLQAERYCRCMNAQKFDSYDALDDYKCTCMGNEAPPEVYLPGRESVPQNNGQRLLQKRAASDCAVTIPNNVNFLKGIYRHGFPEPGGLFSVDEFLRGIHS